MIRGRSNAGRECGGERGERGDDGDERAERGRGRRWTAAGTKEVKGKVQEGTSASSVT